MDRIEPMEEGEPGAFKRIKHREMRLFLRRYSVGNTIQQACEEANITRPTVWRWNKEDPEFAAAFEEAKEAAFEVLEKEAKKRALKGRRKLVVQGGKPVIIPLDPMNPNGEKQYLYEYVYSDALLMFLMKGMKPHIYGNAEIPKAAERESRDGYDDLADMAPEVAERVLNELDAAHREKESAAN